MYISIWQACGKVRGLKTTTRAVFQKMAEYAHKDGTGIYPSHVVLAFELECSTKTIERHVKILLDAGWIVKDHRRPNNLRAYAIPLEKIGLTRALVEASLKRKGKHQPQEEQKPEQPPAFVADGAEYPPSQLHEETTEEKIERVRAHITEIEQQLATARQFGGPVSSFQDILNRRTQRLYRLLEQQEREETHQNEYIETHARR